MPTDPTDPNAEHHQPNDDASADPGERYDIDPMDFDPESYLQIQAERDELLLEKQRLMRAVADAQNVARRARDEVTEARRQGVTSVSRDVITALDHFDMALSQDLSKASAEQVLEGMRAIRGELVRAMGSHGVREMSPAANEPFDPNRHEAVARHPGEGVEPGHVVTTLQVGFLLNDRVVRSAKVVVAPEAEVPGERSDTIGEAEEA